MGKTVLCQFVRQKKVTAMNLYHFCELVIEEELKRRPLLNPPQFRIKFSPLPVNGYVKMRLQGGTQHCIATINIFSLLRNRKGTYGAMCYFYLYATIVHELEHVRLLSELNTARIPEYRRFLATTQQILLSASTKRKGISRKIISQLNNTKIRRRHGIVSLDELICTKAGLKVAFAQLQNALSAEERRIIIEMIESVSFLCESLEIDYRSHDRAYNSFARTFSALAEAIHNAPILLQHFGQLAWLFDKDGSLVPIHLIFQYAKDHPETDLYDEFLIRLFISCDLEWSDFFKNCPAFQRYMEVLANNYCDRCVKYLKNMAVGEIFLKPQVMQDNAAMLIKNTARLNFLMEKFGMKHTKGSVIPLYRI